MKDLTITAIIKVYQYDELNEADRSLMKTAMEATARSYAPYSQLTRRDFVRNVLPCSMPTRSIPTNR